MQISVCDQKLQSTLPFMTPHEKGLVYVINAEKNIQVRPQLIYTPIYGNQANLRVKVGTHANQFEFVGYVPVTCPSNLSCELFTDQNNIHVSIKEFPELHCTPLLYICCGSNLGIFGLKIFN